jgi:hypothetical protein
MKAGSTLESLYVVNNADIDGTLDAGNIKINTNTISSTNEDGNIILDPNGSGAVSLLANTSVTGTFGVSGDTTLTGDLAVNGGDLTTSSPSFDLLNATATTVNAFGAATTIGLGSTADTAVINLNSTKEATSSTVGGVVVDGGLAVAKKAYIGTDLNVGGSTTLGDSVTADTTTVNGVTTINGTTTADAKTFIVKNSTNEVFSVDSSGDTVIAGTLGVSENTTLTKNLAVNGGDITTSSTTATIFNSTATTVKLGEAATTIEIGAATGTTTIKNATTAISKALTVGTTLVVSGDTTLENTEVNGTAQLDGEVTVNNTLTVTGTNKTKLEGAVDIKNSVDIDASSGTFTVDTQDISLDASGTSSNFTLTNSQNSHSTLTIKAENTNTENIGKNTNIEIIAANNAADTTGSAKIDLTADTIAVTGDMTVSGDLTVQGTVITNNVETVSTSNGVVFEGSVADDNEILLKADTVTEDRTILLPNANGTLALLENKLSDFASTTSAQLADVISDGIGSGKLVFGTSPDILTSLTTSSTSFDLLNATATTVNAFGAATTIEIGAATGTTSINNDLAVDGTSTLGGDVTFTNAANRTLRISAVSGEDTAGKTLTVSSGAGTGEGEVSTILFQTPTLGSTGTVEQSLETRLALSETGAAVTGELAVSGNTTLTGDLAVNGGDITTTATTFNFLNKDNVGDAPNSYIVNIGTGNFLEEIDGSRVINIGTETSAVNIPGQLTISGDDLSITGTVDYDSLQFSGTFKALNGEEAVSLTIDNDGNIDTTGTINKLTITKPTNGSILTIADGKTLTVNESITLAGDQARTLTISGANKEIAGTGTKLSLNGAHTTQFNTSENTELTLPTSGTLVSKDTLTSDVSEINNLNITGNIEKTGTANNNNVDLNIGVTNDGTGTKTTSITLNAQETIITGKLTVEGTTTTLNTETLQVEDKNIELGKVASPDNSTANGGGITLLAGVDGDKTILWNTSGDRWDFNKGINVLGNSTVTGTSTFNNVVVNSSFTLNGGDITTLGEITTGTFNATTLTAETAQVNILDIDNDAESFTATIWNVGTLNATILDAETAEKELFDIDESEATISTYGNIGTLNATILNADEGTIDNIDMDITETGNLYNTGFATVITEGNITTLNVDVLDADEGTIDLIDLDVTTADNLLNTGFATIITKSTIETLNIDVLDADNGTKALVNIDTTDIGNIYGTGFNIVSDLGKVDVLDVDLLTASEGTKASVNLDTTDTGNIYGTGFNIVSDLGKVDVLDVELLTASEGTVTSFNYNTDPSNTPAWGTVETLNATILNAETATATQVDVDGISELEAFGTIGSMNITGALSVTGDVDLSAGSSSISGDLTVGGNLIINGTTTTLNTRELTVDDKNIELGSVVEKTNLEATLSTVTNVVTLTNGNTIGMIPGQVLSKTSGTGNFSSGAQIGEIASATQFTVVDPSGTALNHATAGDIVFTVQGASDSSALDGGITLRGTTNKTFKWLPATGWTSNQNLNAPTFSGGTITLSNTSPTLTTTASGAKNTNFISNTINATATSTSPSITKTGLSIQSTGT